MKSFLPLLLLLPLPMLPSCESVRTVYDENGREVKESAPGQEKDLQAHFDEQLDASFSEKRTKDGVPQATSHKVSRFQKQIDEARRSNEHFSTNRFQDMKRNDSRSVIFDASARSEDRNKRYSGLSSYPIADDLRPDFMNETHGISHSHSFTGSGTRSPIQGASSEDSGRTYSTRASDYTTSTTSGYVESRRRPQEEPRIMDYRDYYRKSIQETRTMLGRDKEEEED